MKLSRPATVAIALLAVHLLGISSTAAAQTMAAARSVMVTTTATWGAVAVEEGAIVTTGAPLVVMLDGWPRTTEFFDLVNVGSRPMSAADIIVTAVDTEDGESVTSSLDLATCTSGSWKNNGKCSGTLAPLESPFDGRFTLDATLQPGERVTVQVTVGRSRTAIRSTIDIAVSRSQLLGLPTTNI